MSGIASGPAPLGAETGWAAGAAEIAGAACGEAALAACSLTARVIATTDTTGKKTMIHRIFMRKPLFRCAIEYTLGSRMPPSDKHDEAGTALPGEKFPKALDLMRNASAQSQLNSNFELGFGVRLTSHAKFWEHI